MIASWCQGLALPGRRTLLFAVLLAPSLYMYMRQLWPYRPAVRTRPSPPPVDPSDYYPYPVAAANLTVNLVIASVAADDTSWTSKLDGVIPNLAVIRYVSDSTTAPYRPAVPRKGREATIYHTYLHDFYDRLPDVSILIHAHERPWHMDGVLQQSMVFALSRLELGQIERRGGYANLRVSWRDACPDWINTTKTPDESYKQEEPFMREAWAANFGADAAVPEILAGPCCSQFAVTRAAVRRNPREQYARSRDFLLQTSWSDYIAGRTWEHMFAWLFTGEPRDCPVEWKAYCRMYHICFDSPAAVQRYNDLWKEREGLKERMEFWNELLDPAAGVAARTRTAEIDAVLEADLASAIQRGRDEQIRSGAVGDLFSP